MATTTTKPTYTLQQVEDDLSALRGQVDALNENIQVGSIKINGTAGTNGTGEITIDTWHAFNPLSNSWSVPAGGYAQYRLTPENELQISAWILSPGSGVDGVTIATFPAGYRPQSTHGFPVASDSVNAIATAGLPNAFMTITSAGVMQAKGCSINGNVYIEVKIPLDI